MLGNKRQLPPARRWMLLVLLVPVALLYFGVHSGLDRYAMVKGSEKSSAQVEKITRQVYSYRDSSGSTHSGEHYSYLVKLDAGGRSISRQVLAADFAPDSIWHTSDEIDPFVYAEGAAISVLVRRDLDFAVAHDSFWAIYLSPMLFIGFGLFFLLIAGPVIYSVSGGWPSPRDRPDLRYKLKQLSRSRGSQREHLLKSYETQVTGNAGSRELTGTELSSNYQRLKKRATIEIYLGGFLMLLVCLTLVAVGLYPAYDAMKFPDRAVTAEGKVSGKSHSSAGDQVQTYAVKYETHLGAVLTADIEATRILDFGDTATIYYDPKDPRYARFEPTITLDDAMERAGSRVYLAYFSLGFLCLVLVGIASWKSIGQKKEGRLIQD